MSRPVQQVIAWSVFVAIFVVVLIIGDHVSGAGAVVFWTLGIAATVGLLLSMWRDQRRRG